MYSLFRVEAKFPAITTSYSVQNLSELEGVTIKVRESFTYVWLHGWVAPRLPPTLSYTATGALGSTSRIFASRTT